jgi:formyl-CoA transferase
VIGSIPAPRRDAVPNPLVNSYRTSDSRWIYLVCLQPDPYWLELCTVLERPDLAADERYADMASRAANAAVLIKELDTAFTSRTFTEWRERFAGFTGVWAPALTPAEVHDHVQVGANGYLPEVTCDDGSTYRLPAPPAQFGGQAASPRGPAPELGQHTEEILLELGRDWNDISALRDAGALG